jgi:formylglycine-generating enzyme required for sulfatase activity
MEWKTLFGYGLVAATLLACSNQDVELPRENPDGSVETRSPMQVDSHGQTEASPPKPDTAGMVEIPAGPFWMGCNDTVDLQCEDDERPYHEAFLAGFLIDKTEVTNDAYHQCVQAGACDAPQCEWAPVDFPNHPVVCLDWIQAKTYCAWLDRRLPTEAEWEKAARGVEGTIYPWGNDSPTCDLAVMDEGGAGCGTGETFPVCSRSPAGDSPYGLCDMSGNVWEWVSDFYDDNYYAVSEPENPQGPIAGNYHVHKGGGFYPFMDFKSYLRVSARYYQFPGGKGMHVRGFRCAMSLPANHQ